MRTSRACSRSAGRPASSSPRRGVGAMSEQGTLADVTSAPTATPAPLSFAQQRLWLVDQWDGASTRYHMLHALRLRGDLDRAALGWALSALVERHQILRTRFV